MPFQHQLRFQSYGVHLSYLLVFKLHTLKPAKGINVAIVNYLPAWNRCAALPGDT